MKRALVRKFLPLVGVALLTLAASSRVSAQTFAVWLDGTDGGTNVIPGLLNSHFGAGSATVITTAQLETAGYLDSYSALVMTRQSSYYGTMTLSGAAVSNIQGYVGVVGDANQGGVAVFTNDAADSFTGGPETNDPSSTQLFLNAATYAAASGHGYIGEYNGAAMAFATNANGTALNLLQGNAGPLYQLSIGNFVYAAGPVGPGNPIDAGVTFPFTDGETATFGMVVTGAASNNIVDVFSAPQSQYDNIPAIVANDFVISGGGGGLTPVPEPSTYGLCGTLLLAGLAGYRRIRRKVTAA